MAFNLFYLQIYKNNYHVPTQDNSGSGLKTFPVWHVVKSTLPVWQVTVTVSPTSAPFVYEDTTSLLPSMLGIRHPSDTECNYLLNV